MGSAMAQVKVQMALWWTSAVEQGKRNKNLIADIVPLI